MKRSNRNLLVLFVPLFVLLFVMYAKSKQDRSQQIPEISAQAPYIGDPAKAIQRLSNAIQIPTISAYLDQSKTRASFAKFINFVHANYPLLSKRLHLELVNHYSFYLRWDGKQQELNPALFYAHHDVVPAQEHNLEQWTYGPFSGHIDEQFVWGRGTFDDKNAVIALLESIESLLQQNWQPKRTLYFSFGHDEETGGQQGAQEMAKHFEAKKIIFDFILDEGGALVEGSKFGISKDIALIGIAEKTPLDVTLKVNAQGGHSSLNVEKGAISKLAEAITIIENNPFPIELNSVMEALLLTISEDMSSFNKFFVRNLWLCRPLLSYLLQGKPPVKALMQTSQAFTIIKSGEKSNVLPTEAKAVVNLRLMPNTSVESVVQRYQKLTQDLDVEISAHEHSKQPTGISPIDTSSYKLIAASLQNIFTDAIVAPYQLTGATDSRHFTSLSNNIYRTNAIVLKGKDMKRIHGLNERISKENFLQMINFYNNIITNL